MPKKIYIYCHKDTGNIKTVTKQQAKLLPPEYRRVEFVKNNEGKDVMRFQMEGATVDVFENEVPVEAIEAEAAKTE